MSKKIIIDNPSNLIKFNNVSYIYAPKSPFQFQALKDVNLWIKDSIITAVVGSTGSGKSTLIQHMNGLLIPTAGQIIVGDFLIKAKQRKIKKQKLLRKSVGLVFQFPEYQLFEETIEKDIMFGPLNFGIKKDEARLKAAKYLELVGLGQEYLTRSPFDLSGGQKRRVAIAGILAIEGHTLILDEPTAGLDPDGEEELMKLFFKFNKQDKKRIILVTHNMDHVLQYAGEVVVLKNGQLYHQSDPVSLFANSQLIKEINIEPPKIFHFLQKLKDNGFDTTSINARTVEDLVTQLAQRINSK
ncbi:energy-coupling factor transporter ATPase [Spiroplasma endosymbiont of 'Nebria riversi']|uniref:energy-coupling factor transporter ATPase n=1 Tax=Spiroplasma endosymbiont of 'Nebria riversi' TaxID=2792084 RepID=UPI001C03CEE6|nr:energy-coupling factor transporter ATPase [Spiroplasma endosymbiont of 'Nebria riversi']